MSGLRPLGVSILAVVLFLVSPFFLLGGVVATAKVVVRLHRASPTEFGAIEFMLSVGAVILGLVCAKAAADLWRLKKQSWAPTVFLMCMTALFTSAQVAVGWEGRAQTGLAGVAVWAVVCLLSIWAVVYMRLPGVRAKFTAKAHHAPR